jgi:hypothetical protein
VYPAEVLLDHPSLVYRLLDEFPKIACVIYSARLDLNLLALVTVGTMRADPDRVVNGAVLHLLDARSSSEPV